MKLVLKNIGMLKSAELNLHRLSVIAGENDNGKSTVGKVVFSIIKAINRYKEDFQESKEFKINEKFEKVFFDLRSEILSLSEDKNGLIRLIKNIVDSDFNLKDRLDNFKTLIDSLKSKRDSDKEMLESLQQQYLAIVKLESEPENIKKSMENALNKVFASEFDASILLRGEKEGYIQLYENDLKLIDIKVSSDNRVQLLSDVEPVELKDATFIETPLILNNHDLLIRSQSGLDIKKRNIHRLGIPYTTLHIKDLFDKLTEPSFTNFFSSPDSNNVALKGIIQESIDGEVVYDRKKREFVFRKEDEEISIKNTASGIKVFGLLQILFKNDFLNKNSIIIFDEPENHLHPKWQLKLAKILVDLANNGIYILVSSHSPYMIEALKRFSDKTELGQLTGFYLAENKSIKNEDRLDDTFRILAEPFEVFRKMDEEILRDE